MVKKAKLKSLLGAAAREVADRGHRAADASQASSSKASVLRGSSHLMDAMSGNMDTTVTYEVDPERVAPWRYANRFYDRLTSESCAELIDSIRTHGQLRPAIVRRRHESGGVEYEFIDGGRRWWVAKFLKTRYKIEVRELSDEQAFVLSDDANKQEDISDFERAVEYKAVLAELYHNAQARMAARINISEGQLSKYLALANLPGEVLACVADTRELTTLHAQQLRNAMKGAEPSRRVLERAKALQQARQQGGAAQPAFQVVRALLASGRPGKKKTPTPEIVRDQQGKPLFEAMHTPRALSLRIESASLGSPNLIAALTRFLGEVGKISTGK